MKIQHLATRLESNRKSVQENEVRYVIAHRYVYINIINCDEKEAKKLSKAEGNEEIITRRRRAKTDTKARKNFKNVQ